MFLPRSSWCPSFLGPKASDTEGEELTEEKTRGRRRPAWTVQAGEEAILEGGALQPASR